MGTSRSENREQWLKHVAQAAEHADGMSAYCREQGISVGALQYWKNKCGSKVNEVAPASRSAFVPVQVLDQCRAMKGSPLPDPKWVAGVLFHLMESIQGAGAGQ